MVTLWRCGGEFLLMLVLLVTVVLPARGQEGSATSPLCARYRQHYVQALEQGKLDFATSARVGSSAWRATGHTLALAALWADESCGDRAAASAVGAWLERTLRDESPRTTSSQPLAPPWFEHARFLRLLGVTRGQLARRLAPVAVQKAECAVREILGWQDSDGLVWCDERRSRKLLLENLEALLALRAAAGFLRSQQSVTLAREGQAAADRLHEAIETKLWQGELGRYAWAVESSGTLETRAERWYPDMVSQLAAVAFLPPHSGLRQLFDDLLGGLDLEKINVARPQDVEVAAWYALAARNAGAGALYKKLKEVLQQVPASTWYELPAETCLVVVVALSPRGS